MPSLSAHLRTPDDHGRLRFHPDCPVCRRERLAGPLPPDELVSRRTQATITAALLAVSAGGVQTAFAGERDQVSGGTSAPQQAGGSDPAHDPDFDPGGEPTELPFDAPAPRHVHAPPDPGSDDSAPLELEPASDPHEPVADPGDAIAAPSDDPQPAADATPPPAEVPAPAPAPPSAGSTPTAGAPHVVDPAVPTPQPAASEPATTNDDARTHQPRKRSRAHTDASKPRSRPAPASEPAPLPDATSTSAEMKGAVSGGEAAGPGRAATNVAGIDRIAPGDRFHVVRPGESLWSIAADLLDRDDVSPAQVAREVNRLWTRNEQRIGTGDRDLLPVGTRLRLR